MTDIKITLKKRLENLLLDIADITIDVVIFLGVLMGIIWAILKI